MIACIGLFGPKGLEEQSQDNRLEYWRNSEHRRTFLSNDWSIGNGEIAWANPIE